MAISNGQPKAANGISHGPGNMNGKLNGNGAANGKPLVRGRVNRKQRGFFAATFSILARLATWAAILTVLFRCPNSLDSCDDSSPYICGPYFEAKNAIVPHAKPYYDHYAAPYVDVARPYYQAVDNTILSPTRNYAVQYGGPWAQKAQNFALEQWKESGEPKLTQLRDASQSRYEQSVEPLLQQANAAFGPYYEIARTNGLQAYYEYLLPGYKFAQPYLLQGYQSAADFTTNSAVPAAHWTWNKTYAFVDTAVWPQIRALYLEHVDPQLVRIGERLGRYKAKAKQSSTTGSIPEPSDIKEAVASSFNKPSSQQLSQTTSTGTRESEPAETVQAADIVEDAYENPVQPPPPAENETEKRRKAREMVAHDLELWQNKYAAAADQGAADMEERVNEIAQQKIAQDVEITGRALAKELTGAVDTQSSILKTRISEIVASEELTGSAADEEVTLAVRSAGVAIKDKAQALRAWRETFDKNLQNTVIRAADVHFQILDETRGLALQEIGMRWAWTDGVTYKDWAKYHELKATLNTWTEQLKQLIVTNPALLEAQDAAAQVEDEAMEVASSAAKELVRLKEVAHYKIVANDATESFETEAMRLAAEAALAAKQAEKAAEQSAKEAAAEAQAQASQLSESVEEQSTAASQSASSLLSEGEEATSEIGEEISSSASSVSTEAGGIVSQVSSLASEATESVKSVVADASETAEEFSEAASASVHQVVDEVEDSASEVSSDASEGVSSLWDDAESVATEEATEVSEEFLNDKSEAEAAATAMASEASEAIVGQTQSIVSNLTEDPADDKEVKDAPVEVEEDPLAAREETPVSDDAAPVKPAFLGAVAQEVPDRQPILEDYVDTDYLDSATKAAGNAYATAVAKASEQYSSAVSVVSAQIYGTPKPVHEQLLASVSAAYDFAVAAASTKYEQAVGTPTPTSNPAMVDWNKVEEIAAQRLNEGRLWAELQYQSAVIALGLATPTPSSASEKYLEQAKRNYFAGLGLAQDRYSSFLGAASSVMSSMTATPTPTNFVGHASSAAAAARESAESIANLAEEAVESAYAAAGEKVASVANAVDDSIAGVVDGVTEQAYLAGAAFAETWDNAIAQISGQVYGEQKHLGWYDGWFDEASSYVSSATEAIADGASVASDKAEDSAVTASAEAAKQYDAVSQLVSELVSGKEPTFSESVLSRLSAAYATAAAGFESYASEASAAAASVGGKVGSAASEATEAVKESVQHARDEL